MRLRTGTFGWRHGKRLTQTVAARQVVLGRELTKRYEEFLRGKPAELLAHMRQRSIKGEFVVIVEGGSFATTETM